MPLDPRDRGRCQDLRAIRFRVGERTLWTAYRQLSRIALDLDSVIDGQMPVLPPAIGDGYELRSLPSVHASAIRSAHGHFIQLERQRYPRHYVRLDRTFRDYLAGFSAKTRSTLLRKRRRWIEAAGGMDLREYHGAEAAEEFHRLAGALSARTYQARLLNAGLPMGPEAIADFRRRAAAGEVRAYLLFHRGEPASYLHLPVDDGCVIYAHLGYEPSLASLSPGTVLQLEALERLFAETQLRLFDFTEGDGAHKRLFANGNVECVDLLLLNPSMRNRLLVGALGSFDKAVGATSMLAARSGIKPAIRRWLRGR